MAATNELSSGSATARRSALVCALLAATLAGGYHLLFGDLGLNLRDEGYLWYGVVAVLDGDLPLRDFQAYDPGRYLWCAAWSPLVGEGLLGLRAAAAAFQAVGLFFGLLAARRVLNHDFWLLPVGLVLVLWCFPRHKVFEPAIAMAAVYAGASLLARPSLRRHVACGAFVGLMAFVGRNHGLYLGASFAMLIALAQWKLRAPDLTRRLAGFAGGVLFGYTPMLLLVAFAPGFGEAFFEALLSVTERGTNLPKEYPWPWRMEWSGLDGAALLGQVGVAGAFLLGPVLIPLGLLLTLRTPATALGRRGVLIAAAVLSLVYLHHVSVRSDLPHLAQSIHPILLLALALPAATLAPGRAFFAAPLLLLMSLPAVFHGHPELKHFRPGATPVDWVDFEVDDQPLRLKFAQARHLERVRQLVERYVEPDEALFIAPTSPTLYPLLGKRSPTWWIYFLWPATEEEQDRTIAALAEQDVNWALIVEKSFDHLPDYDFRQTNPRVWEHLEAEFTRVLDPLVPPDYFLFRRRAPSGVNQ